MSKTKLSVRSLQAWAKGNADFALSVVAAQALAQTTRDKVNSYANPAILKYGFISDRTGAPITEAEQLYRTSQDASEYYAELDRLHAENGFSVEPEYCPALIAEHQAINAENALLASFCEAMDFPSWTKLDDRAKLLKMILQMAIGEAAKIA